MYVNAFQQFLALLPSEPLLIGTIVSTSGGMHGISLLGGGTTLVPADDGFTIGSKVFVRGGMIQSAAPTLTEIEILV